MAVRAAGRGLNRESRALLEYVRRVRPANRVYGVPEETVVNQAHATVDRIVQSSGLAHIVVDELRWFTSDVARALANGQGEELSFELEGLLGKWLRYDLEPNTVQLLLRILLRQVAGIEMPTEENPESGIQRPVSRVAGPVGEMTAKNAKNAKTASSKPEARMTIQTRSANAPHPDPLLSEERGSGATVRREVANEEAGANPTTKTQRHKEDSESATGTLEPSDPGILPTNDERERGGG
jgi:hypothetical protein